MKILHILSDGPAPMTDQIIKVQAQEHEVKTVDLSKKTASYDSIVDDIFSYDRVISW